LCVHVLRHISLASIAHFTYLLIVTYLVLV